METNIGADLKKATASLKISMDTITKDCVTKLEAQYQQVLQQLTPYDSEDAKRVLNKQVQLLDTLERTNAALVSENSRLRLHHSFVPIRYREEIERMQQQDAQLYREQNEFPRSSRLKIRTITAAQSNSSRHREHTKWCDATSTTANTRISERYALASSNCANTSSSRKRSTSAQYHCSEAMTIVEKANLP